MSMESKSLTDALRAAADQVTKAGLPDHLEPVAFDFVLRSQADLPLSQESHSPQGATKWSQQVARHIKLEDVRLVEDSIHWGDGRLEITLARDTFGEAKAEAQRQAALIVVAATEALTDDWVPIDSIRETCQDLKIYDRNLATNLRGLENAIRVRGSGGDLKYRLTAPGLDRARQLITARFET